MGDWANHHINWTWFIANFVVGALLGFILGIVGALPLTYIVGVIIALVSTVWLLDRKERSMWFLLLLIVPLGWIVLLVLESKDYWEQDSQEMIPPVNWELEERYIHDPSNAVERAWNEVIQDLVNKGEVPKKVLTNKHSALYWWRHISLDKQNEISNQIENIDPNRESLGD